MGSHGAGVHGTSNDAKEELPWQLPPGFRFHPTDEELVTFYLANKTQNPNFSDQAISDADLNKSEPWELPGKAKMGEKEWYFFSLKDLKYPTGVRTNRATHAGYWKATGKDREVMSSQKGLKGKIVVGMKKTLVFYTGRAPKGTKSNWVMHEYRVEEPLKGALKLRSSKDEWVLCRVFHKSAGGKKMTLSELQLSCDATNIIEARMIGTITATSLPPLTELPWKNSQVSLHATSPPVFGQTQPVTGSASHHQVANLLSSLPAVATSCTLDAPSGNAIFTALFQHYNSSTQQQQSRRKPETEVQDYGQVYVQHNLHGQETEVQDYGQSRRKPETEVQDYGLVYVQHNLHVPVSTSLGDPLNVNTTQSPASAAPDAFSDSCASAIDFASDGHPYIPRLPSDLESFWLKSDQRQ